MEAVKIFSAQFAAEAPAIGQLLDVVFLHLSLVHQFLFFNLFELNHI